MKQICEDLKEHLSEVLLIWERMVREEPWANLPSDHRIDNLPDVLVGMANAALCCSEEFAAHRYLVLAATEHGFHRRRQEIAEHLILTEYHLLRQAVWAFIRQRYGPSKRTAEAIMRLDTAMTVATHASLWGYHRWKAAPPAQNPGCGPSKRTAEAIMRLDTAMTVATHASLWGYHRPEIIARGNWERDLERIARSSPLLRSADVGRGRPGGPPPHG